MNPVMSRTRVAASRATLAAMDNFMTGLSRYASKRGRGGRAGSSVEEPVEPDHFHPALALDVDLAARDSAATVGDLPPGRAAEHHRPGHAVALHARRGVHRVTPQVEQVLPPADHPRHHRADVDADAHVPAGRQL